MIASVCGYLVSFGQLFLLQAEKKSGEELLFIRMIYEDIKTQRMYHKRPERREEMIPYDIQIVDNNGVIEKVFVNMEKEAISIEKTSNSSIYADWMSNWTDDIEQSIAHIQSFDSANHPSKWIFAA